MRCEKREQKGQGAMAYTMKEIIVMVSVLIICILLIRRIFRREIGRRFQYALWFLVALRLMIPVSIPVHLSVEIMNRYPFMEVDTDDMVDRLEEPIQVTVDSRNRIYRLLADGSAGTADRDAEAFWGSGFFMVRHLGYSWVDVLGIIWTMGMIVIAAWIFITNGIFGHRLKRKRTAMELPQEAESALFAKLPSKIAGMYAGMKVYVVEGLASPCLYGLPGREAVYLTPDIVKDTDKLCHVLTHELCHKRHGDSLWGIIRGLLVTVYWFHPLVWVAAILSKRDCELACDETALILLGEEERISYGETLLSIITNKTRISDVICTATTMTGSGKSVKERIGFIARKPKVLRMAVLLTALLMALVFVVTFMKYEERVRILVFGNDMDTVMGADMQIPLPDSVRRVCGQVKEKGNDDIIIYHVESEQEVGRFCQMSLKDALGLVDEGRRVVPLGNYGNNNFLKAYLGIPIEYVTEETMHTYTPAGQEDEHSGAEGVPGTDSNIETDSDTETEHIYVPEVDNNTVTEYVIPEDGSSSTQIPAPEDTDTYTIFLPFEEGQSLTVEDLASEEDDTTYMLEDKVDYLPNEEIITTTTYPAKEIDIDHLSYGRCYVYVKADYGDVETGYLEEMEQMNGELESVAEEVVVLSLNREIREELFDALTDNRTPYVGNNSKVGAMVNALPVPLTLNYTGEFALQTVQEPYSLRFAYEMTQDSLLQEDLDMIHFNAVMLFYAIGNVDEISISIKQPMGNETKYSFHVYYRTDLEETYGGLLTADYEDTQIFREGLEKLYEKIVSELHN